MISHRRMVPKFFLNFFQGLYIRGILPVPTRSSDLYDHPREAIKLPFHLVTQWLPSLQKLLILPIYSGFLENYQISVTSYNSLTQEVLLILVQVLSLKRGISAILEYQRPKRKPPAGKYISLIPRFFGSARRIACQRE